MSTSSRALMLSVPEDKLPEEWKDEARLDSLFSPFRSRTVNPRDYDTKVTSWKEMIALYCVNNSVYIFTQTLLNRAFVRNGRPPTCLKVVVDELLKSGTIQLHEEFLKASPQSWSGWMANTLKKPLSWSYNTIRRSLFTNVSPEVSYVHLEVIKEESLKLLSSIPDKYRNKVVNFPEFLKLVNKDVGQAESVKLLLHHLAKGKKMDATVLNNSTNLGSLLVKIGHPISDTDIGVYVLELNEKLFTKQVEELEDNVAACIVEVKGHLRKGHRQLAKTCLKKKHEIDKRLIGKTNVLHNIQVLLEKIKDVHTDADVLESYKLALSAFNATLEETGLSEGAVEDTLLKLGEMMDLHEDIQSSITSPVSSDNADLEDELAELVKSGELDATNSNADDNDLLDQLGKLDINSLPEINNSNLPKKVSLG